MAVNYVAIDNNTLIDLRNDTVTSGSLLENITAHDANGGVIEGSIPTQHAKTVTPTTTDIVAVASGYYTDGSIIVKGDADLVAGNIKKDVNIFGVNGSFEGAEPTGSITITQNGTHDVTDYATANVAVPQPSPVEQATPTVSINQSTGLITASATQSAGSVPAGTKTATLQLSTAAARTITPGTTSQTAINSNTYATGNISVAGDADLVSGNIKKDVNIFGVIGSYEATEPAGTITITQNGTHDVSDYATANVQVSATPVDLRQLNVTENGTYTPSGFTGYDRVTVAVPQPSPVEQATPTVSINQSTGLITASVTQAAGSVSAGTKTATQQLSTAAARTITPGTTSQTAISAHTYATGNITVAGDTDLVAGNIKKGVNIFGVAGAFEGGGFQSAVVSRDSTTTLVFASENEPTEIIICPFGSYALSSSVVYPEYLHLSGATFSGHGHRSGATAAITMTATKTYSTGECTVTLGSLGSYGANFATCDYCVLYK